MISYKLCSDVDANLIHQAFQVGFSDYIIPIQMPKEIFSKHFFGPEGNELKYSYLALDGDKPVGLILGGIKEYEGIKTLRCGTLCVHPDYRGKGVSSKLFELHKQIGIENNCKQLFLEVIVGNDRAIKFYEKQGYEKIYDLSYYYHKAPTSFVANKDLSYIIKEINIDLLRSLRNSIYDIHISWQNDLDYMNKLENHMYYGVYNNERLIGSISASKGGKIYFIWVDPEYRKKGIATNLIIQVINISKPEKLYINFPNNRNLGLFVNHLNFAKDKISQYEMYLTLQ